MPDEKPATPDLKLIAKGWQTYRACVLPQDTPAIQIQECKRAFYAGAWYVVRTIEVLGDEHVSVIAAAMTMQSMCDESEQFCTDVSDGKE